MASLVAEAKPRASRTRADVEDTAPDPIDPEISAALADEPQAEAMSPLEGSDAVKKMTHEVDADDVFSSTT